MGSQAQGCDGCEMMLKAEEISYNFYLCFALEAPSKVNINQSPHHTALHGKQRLATPLPSAGIWTSQSQGSDH